MSKPVNKYSFVLPVRNGGHYVKECISSILSQSYPHFDLLLLENKSEDNTVSVAEAFQDSRIRIIPSDRPLSIEENWQRAVTIPKNEYMTFTGHDDLFDRDYLLAMDKLVHSYPEASLYQSHFRYVDSKGTEIGNCTPMDEIMTPAVAIRNFISGKTDVIGTGFLMRSKDFEATGGMAAYPNLLFADMEMWMELSRKSFLAVEPSELFSYRKHSASTTSGTPDARLLAAFTMMVRYLSELQKKEPSLAEVIQSSGQVLLLQYCVGLTHSVLCKPREQRKTPHVGEIIETFRDFALQLGITDFEPLSHLKLRVANTIDRNSLLHRLFIWFSPIRLHSTKVTPRQNHLVTRACPSINTENAKQL